MLSKSIKKAKNGSVLKYILRRETTIAHKKKAGENSDAESCPRILEGYTAKGI